MATDVVVIGLPDHDMDTLIERLVEYSGGPVIVDLRELALRSGASSNSFDGLVAALHRASSSCCVVTTRRGVQVLRGRSPVAVFTSLGEAVQAHRLAESGYGPGWTPLGRG